MAQWRPELRLMPSNSSVPFSDAAGTVAAAIHDGKKLRSNRDLKSHYLSYVQPVSRWSTVSCRLSFVLLIALWMVMRASLVTGSRGTRRR